MRFVEELPERRVVFTREVLAELRARPGEWALVRTYAYKHPRTFVKHPPDIELDWRWFGTYPKQTSELYARAKVQP